MFKNVIISILFLCFLILPQNSLHSQDTAFGQKYLFYMHGRWVEMHGPNSAHPKHGYYEYDKIVDYFSEKGFTVISEARSGNINIEVYAGKVAGQIEGLLSKGVKPENITVIGHSKGGLMILIVSALLKEANINFVVMAGCGREGTRFRAKFEEFLYKYASRLSGRILSIYDKSDRIAGSCQEAFDKAGDIESREIVLDTGEGHGIFYYPNTIWTEEIINWSDSE